MKKTTLLDQWPLLLLVAVSIAAFLLAFGEVSLRASLMISAGHTIYVGTLMAILFHVGKDRKKFETAFFGALVIIAALATCYIIQEDTGSLIFKMIFVFLVFVLCGALAGKDLASGIVGLIITFVVSIILLGISNILGLVVLFLCVAWVTAFFAEKKETKQPLITGVITSVAGFLIVFLSISATISGWW